MNSTNILKQEFDYYLQHKQDFVEKYNNQFIGLKMHRVICEANSREEAINKAIKNGNELGTFLVQHVTKDDSETMQRYCSRVYC